VRGSGSRFHSDLPRRATHWVSGASRNSAKSFFSSISTPPALGDATIESLAPGRDGDPVDRLANWLLTATGQPT
jgi:hypothetical protein